MILMFHQVLTGVFVQVSREALNSFTIIPDDLWYHCSISSHFPTPLLSQLGNILSGWCGCHFYSYSLAQLSDCGLCFRVSLFVHHDSKFFSLSCAITSLNTIHHFLSHALYPWSPDLSLYSWEWNNQHWQWQDGRDYIHYIGIDMEISCLPESIESEWWTHINSTSDISYDSHSSSMVRGVATQAINVTIGFQATEH